jgi:hypothetical protein
LFNRIGFKQLVKRILYGISMFMIIIAVITVCFIGNLYRNTL